MKKIRVGAVSYLNTRPLVYGFRDPGVREQIELTEDYPARIAKMLADDEIDLGLIPIAAVLNLKHWEIVGDYCIGCTGPVASVCIFSQVPMEDIEKVYLDYQSRTSVNLAKILLREYWKKDVEFLDAKDEDFREKIKGTTAAVVIGDRALEQRNHSKYIYDLGEAWIDHTGLPFVFAAWIANKPLPAEFTRVFNHANAIGLENLDKVIGENSLPYYDLEKYYRQNISYRLDEQKRKAISVFLGKLSGQ